MNFRVSKRSRIFILAGLGMLALAVILTTRFCIKGRYEGLFLLKGKKDSLFVLKDDLYLGDGSRLIIGFDMDGPRESIRKFMGGTEPDRPYLRYDWDEKDGKGFVRNFLPGGGELITCLGRYLDSDGEEVHGLFVGGGLPKNVRDNDVVKENETGMAYNDGKRWYHVWCTTN